MTRIVCNPIDLSYRYQDFGAGPLRAVYREAADPSIVRYRDHYYLFASMSGGFWHSADLARWTFVRTATLPAGDYAPDAAEIDGVLHFTASRRRRPAKIWTTKDPVNEGFQPTAAAALPYWDPHLFHDDDGRTYAFWGCSNSAPLIGAEIDPGTHRIIGEPTALLRGNPKDHGWERNGESNRMTPPRTVREKVTSRLFGTHSEAPYIEGAWLTKHNGTYYLQYSAPGTEYNVYADGYYTSSSPLGPYVYSPDSPFSLKPGGFITGAGHGSTFQDRHGNWWHASTMRISVNHHFERRIGIWPAGFDADGVLYCDQQFGDYPFIVPDGPVAAGERVATGWMLLNYRATTTATSSLNGHEPSHAVNEDSRTWWVAGSSQPGEALTVDMGEARTVHAIQVNVADHQLGRHKPKRPRRDPDWQRAAFRSVLGDDHPVRYTVETSADGATWTTHHDGRTDHTDSPHHLVVPPDPVACRFVRVTGVSQPWNAHLAISGLRVFGTSDTPPPSAVTPSALRSGPLDARVVWEPSDGAEGYNVRWGRKPGKLYHSWQVWGACELELSSLTAGHEYWLAVDAYNPGGVTQGEPILIKSEPVEAAGGSNE